MEYRIEHAYISFRIWYGDGSSYGHEDGDPYHAPPHNVQAVASGTGGVRTGKEAYYWTNELGWQACDQNGLNDYCMMYVGPKAMLYGRTVRNERFWAIKKRAEMEWANRIKLNG